jgi:hypothetical protein
MQLLCMHNIKNEPFFAKRENEYFSNNIFLNEKRHYICSPEQNGYGLVP